MTSTLEHFKPKRSGARYQWALRFDCCYKQVRGFLLSLAVICIDNDVVFLLSKADYCSKNLQNIYSQSVIYPASLFK